MSATTRSTYTIWCDHRAECCRRTVRSDVSRADARRKAKKDGWAVNIDKVSRTGGYDFCPGHKPEGA